MINILSQWRILWSKLARKILRRHYDYRPFYNYFYYTGRRLTKCALLSYRILPVRYQAQHSWSASGDTFDIIRVLNELGYKTDIVWSRDQNFIPTKKYDLFIGHEGLNFKRLVEGLPASIPKIFYSTTAYWQFLNQAEQSRLDDLSKRRGVVLKGERTIFANEDEVLHLADGVILLGNKDCADTYPVWARNKIYTLEGGSFVNKKIINPSAKDFAAARNNWLILSGSGNVHKGLDLVLEAFAKLSEYNLYICCVLEEDFKKEYERELFHTPNIHYLGYIKLYSRQFYDLISTCNYLIFPSGGEGSPGSVADSMIQGLIPVVSRHSHIDVEGLGFYLEPVSIEKIRELVVNMSAHADSWYREHCRQIQLSAANRFDPDVFRKNFKEFVNKIISQKI